MYRNSKLQQAPLAHACTVQFLHARGNHMSHGSIRQCGNCRFNCHSFAKQGLKSLLYFQGASSEQGRLLSRQAHPNMLQTRFSHCRNYFRQHVRVCRMASNTASPAQRTCACVKKVRPSICKVGIMLCCAMLHVIHTVSAAVDVVSVVTPPYLHCRQFLGERLKTAAYTLRMTVPLAPITPCPPPPHPFAHVLS